MKRRFEKSKLIKGMELLNNIVLYISLLISSVSIIIGFIRKSSEFYIRRHGANDYIIYGIAGLVVCTFLYFIFKLLLEVANNIHLTRKSNFLILEKLEQLNMSAKSLDSTSSNSDSEKM